MDKDVTTQPNKNILNKAPMLLSLLLLASTSVILMLQTSSSKWKSYADICEGNKVLHDSSGREYQGPEKCDNYNFTLDGIDYNNTEGNRGRALLWQDDWAIFPENIGGDFGEIAVNVNLPDCVKDIVVEKEWKNNGNTFGFLASSGSFKNFSEINLNGLKLNDAGIAFGVAVAIHEATIATTDEDRKCLAQYDTTFDEGYFSKADAIPGLDALTQDGDFTHTDLCITINAALNHLNEIDNTGARNEIIEVQNEIGCLN